MSTNLASKLTTAIPSSVSLRAGPPSFVQIPGIQTLVPSLAQQVSYPLSHPPRT